MDPPGNLAEMSILVHQTWQTNILWQMDPQVIVQRCLEYWYTKLADEHGRWTPHELRIDALNTATPNLADEPTLADGPPT